MDEDGHIFLTVLDGQWAHTRNIVSKPHLFNQGHRICLHCHLHVVDMTSDAPNMDTTSEGKFGTLI